MLRKLEYPASGEYRTGSQHEPICFFLNALPKSKEFDILLGYFSSSAIHVLSLGFASFIYNGGKVKMVINHILSPKDRNAVIEGSKKPESFFDFSASNFNQIKDALDEYGIHFFNCLAWLIASERIKIRVVKPTYGKGISHYKSGIFSDGQDKVKFKSSCNFTAFGLLENLEELDIKPSWSSENNVAAIDEYESYFNRIFEGNADFVEHLPFENIEEAIKENFGDNDIQELLVEESRLIEKKKAITKIGAVKKILESLEKHTKDLINQPRFPFPEPRDYQVKAYDNWINNDYKGIFAMATGTGKTITALNCILKEYWRSAEKSFRVVILVPTITLVEQWEKEAKAFNFSKIIKISSKIDWEQELGGLLTFMRFGGSQSFILICTYATFYRPKFQHHFQKLPSDTILIADEGHNIASPKVSEVLPSVHLHKRLGLSATPKRIYDPEGTRAMEEFFCDTEPYTYSFTMERAIEEGVLCQYKYFPHLVSLTSTELEDYVQISGRLIKLFDFKNGKFKESELVEKLLLARKRIIHKAANKLDKTLEILQQHFLEKGDLKFTFVYVPEGFSPLGDEQWYEDEEDLRLINQYTQAVGNIHPKIIISQFTGVTKDRDYILKQFQEGEIHVLASMKCLDEGVDIPRAEFAIFCSSTGNPRQFIQRRGRVLRTHPDKHLAIIHDLVVVPDFEGTDLEEETFNMERKLVLRELERVAHFAFMSINRYYTLETLETVCKYYNLNLHTIHQNLQSI